MESFNSELDSHENSHSFHGSSAFTIFDADLNRIIYKSNNSGYQVLDIDELSNGNYMIAGELAIDNGSLPLIREYNSSGNVVSESSFNAMGSQFTVFYELSDGNYFLHALGNGVNKFIKIDPSANYLWTVDNDTDMHATDVIELNNQIIIGQYSSGNGSDIRSYDLNGNLLWKTSYGGKYSDIYFTLHSSGDIIASYKNQLYGGASLMRIDSSGNILWEKTYEDLPQSEFEDITNNAVESSDGNLIVLSLNKHTKEPGEGGVYKVDVNDGTKLLP